MSNALWTDDRLVPDAGNAIGLSYSPAAAVLNGRIYIFHHGRGDDHKIWYTTFDGSRWGQDTPLPGGSYYGISNSPTVVEFQGKLWVFYQVSDDNGKGRLGWGTLDGNGYWNGYAAPLPYKLSYSPSAAVFQNRLYVAYQGSDNTAGQLMFTSTDGSTFAPEARVADINMLGGPALTVYQNRLHCFHKGTNHTYDARTAVMLDNICELMGIDDPWAAMLIDMMISVAEDMTEIGNIKMAVQTGIAIGEAASTLTSRTGDWTWHTAFDGSGWRSDVLCPSGDHAYGINSEAPAAIEYANCLFNIRQGRDSSYLWFGVYNGNKWFTDQKLGVPGNTYCTTGAPALVVFNGTLYCFHQTRDDGGWMMMTTLTAPPRPQPAPAVSTTPTPTAAPVNIQTLTNRILISCDNAYTLYFNGTQLGSGDNWQAMGNYPISLNPGRNVVAVKGLDAGGVAALIAEVRAGARMYTSGSYDWKVSLNGPAGWETGSFDDSAWVSATEYGAYGSGPWGTNISGWPADSRARWIWSGNNDADNQVYMRLTFDVAPNARVNPGISEGNAAHTVAAWIKPTSLPANRAWIMTLGNEGTGAHHWLLNSNGSTQFGAWGGAQLSPSLALQNWVHIAMVFNGSSLSCYVNGAQTGSCPASFNLQGIPLDFGRAHIGEEDFRGFVQSARVYARALTAAEVVNAMNGKS